MGFCLERKAGMSGRWNGKRDWWMQHLAYFPSPDLDSHYAQGDKEREKKLAWWNKITSRCFNLLQLNHRIPPSQYFAVTQAIIVRCRSRGGKMTRQNVAIQSCPCRFLWLWMSFTIQLDRGTVTNPCGNCKNTLATDPGVAVSFCLNLRSMALWMVTCSRAGKDRAPYFKAFIT